MKKILIIVGLIILSIPLIYGIRVWMYGFAYRNNDIVFIDENTIEYNNALYHLVDFKIGRDLKEEDILIYENPPAPFMTGYHQIFINNDERFLYETTFGSKDYKHNLAISQYLDRIYVREDINITKELFFIPNTGYEFCLFDELVNINDTEIGKFMNNNYDSLSSLSPNEDKFYLKTNKDIYFYLYDVYKFNDEYYLRSNGIYYEISDKLCSYLILK